jgi:GTP cyclohydrolase I
MKKTVQNQAKDPQAASSTKPSAELKQTPDIYELAELLNGKEIDQAAIQEAVGTMLQAFGEDPELLAGYRIDPVEMINDACFEVNYDEMVIVRDIEFFSLCEHHMLPFVGRAHVAYIPRGRVIGLSKIPRIVDLFARRLQVQERMTQQVADFLNGLLHPLGVAVVIEALHLCAMMRGVKKHDARMTTSAMLGGFRSNPSTRQEFLDNISRGANPLSF